MRDILTGVKSACLLVAATLMVAVPSPSLAYGRMLDIGQQLRKASPQTSYVLVAEKRKGKGRTSRSVTRIQETVVNGTSATGSGGIDPDSSAIELNLSFADKAKARGKRARASASSFTTLDVTLTGRALARGLSQASTDTVVVVDAVTISKAKYWGRHSKAKVKSVVHIDVFTTGQASAQSSGASAAGISITRFDLTVVTKSNASGRGRTTSSDIDVGVNQKGRAEALAGNSRGVSAFRADVDFSTRGEATARSERRDRDGNRGDRGGRKGNK